MAGAGGIRALRQSGKIEQLSAVRCLLRGPSVRHAANNGARGICIAKHGGARSHSDRLSGSFAEKPRKNPANRCNSCWYSGAGTLRSAHVSRKPVSTFSPPTLVVPAALCSRPAAG
ncbi:MAG TPA: hypothetical protein VM847_08210, partial [Tahibacter sp.]|nr:hypothetical protein [Tahibacter sp.]